MAVFGVNTRISTTGNSFCGSEVTLVIRLFAMLKFRILALPRCNRVTEWCHVGVRVLHYALISYFLLLF